MGKVFSWEEIERGEIPQFSGFSTVVGKIRQDLVATEGIIGGILCGSFLWNKHTRRSDIDCIVVYDPAKRRKVIAALQDISGSAASLHVPLELIPLDVHIARTPLHHIGRSFAVHLRYATENGGVIKENPLPLFVFDDTNDAEDIRGYLRNKLRRLEKGVVALPVMETAELHRFLREIFDAPVHIARKVLWLQGVETSDDSKQTVLRRYPDIANAEERNLFAKITSTDSKYTAELLVQLRRPDKNRYSRTIEEIKTLAWDTLEFVRLNALRLV